MSSEKRMKQLIEADKLASEIGDLLVDQAFKRQGLEFKLARLERELELLQGVEVARPLEPEWFELLERLNKGDPMVLLKYLNVPKRVRAHIEDLFRDRK